jgi:hypothetical protein
MHMLIVLQWPSTDWYADSPACRSSQPSNVLRGCYPKKSSGGRAPYLSANLGAKIPNFKQKLGREQLIEESDRTWTVGSSLRAAPAKASNQYVRCLLDLCIDLPLVRLVASCTVNDRPPARTSNSCKIKEVRPRRDVPPLRAEYQRNRYSTPSTTSARAILADSDERR